MDWNAMGTWAAVIVALGLALREAWTRTSERRAAHLITSARILPSAMRMDEALRENLAEADTIKAQGADTPLLLDVCDAFAHRLDANGLGRFRGVADQQGALPPGMLVPLIKALMLEEMLLENHSIVRDADMTADQAKEEFENWIEQMKAIRTSLRWIIHGAQKRMGSWRWRHPEVGAFAKID